MKKLFQTGLSIAVMIFLQALVFGQEKNESMAGKITDVEGKPVFGVVVELRRAVDSGIVKTVISDQTGVFAMQNIKPGKYLLTTSHVNFQRYQSEAFNFPSSDQSSFSIQLAVKSAELSKVVVQSRKPVITLLGDKMIVNPGNMAGTNTSNALDLMKNMPGITVENQDKLTLNGSSDVTILIDDRKRTMSLDQAIRLLKTIPATNVKQVEISIGKSARNDASGNGGVINIVTKKQLGNGYNLQWTSQAIINNYIGHSHNLYLNYKYNRWSLFTSVGYERNYNYTNSGSLSTYGLGNQKLQVEDAGQTLSKSGSPYLDLGLDYELNRNNVIGVTGSLYKSRNYYNSYLKTDIDPVAEKSITNFNRQYTPETLNSFDILYTGKLDTLGSKLKVDLGYLSGYAKTQPFYTNLYRDKTGQPIQDEVNIQAYLPLNGSQYIAQVDVEKNLPRARQWQAGFKHTRGVVNNTANYDTVRNNLLIPDLRRQEDLRYKEGITAAYVSYRQTFRKKFTLIAGLRFENTDMTNISNISDSSNHRTFNDFFPSLSFSINGRRIKSTINFNRSISRPYYGYLNPYVTYIDEFTLQEGNASLKPGYTYSVNLTNVYNNFLYLSVGYSRAQEMLFLLKRQVPDTTLTLIRPENALSYHAMFISLSASYSLYKEAWEGQMRVYGFLYRNQLKPEFKTSSLDERTLGRMVISTTNTVRLLKDLFLESAFYYYNRNRSNQSEFGSRWQADLGLSRKFLSGGVTASIYAADIFNTMGQDRLRYYDGYTSSSYIRYSTRLLRVSLIVNMGKLNSNFQKNTSTKKESTRFKESQ